MRKATADMYIAKYVEKRGNGRLSFSDALACVKEGRSVRRVGWLEDDKAMFLVRGWRADGDIAVELDMGESVIGVNFIDDDGAYAVGKWGPNMEDILAEDWVLLS